MFTKCGKCYWYLNGRCIQLKVDVCENNKPKCRLYLKNK
jgi:hypothetical protein